MVVTFLTSNFVTMQELIGCILQSTVRMACNLFSRTFFGTSLITCLLAFIKLIQLLSKDALSFHFNTPVVFCGGEYASVDPILEGPL